MSKFTVLGVELEYDFFDADELEKYEAENLKVDEDFNNIDYKGMSNADGLRAQCKIINTFFDNMFGAGTADRLFHGKNNIKDHLEAFAIVTSTAVNSETDLRSVTDRYNPNRAQRRFDQKNANRQNGGNGNFNPNGNRKNGNKYGNGHRG